MQKTIKKNSSVVCIGELLIDFFCTDIDVDLTNGKQFLKNAGGAPANVSAAIAKLGGDALFSGKVGADSFGYFLKRTLEDLNVDTSMLVRDNEAITTLAFVSLTNDGERDFMFHRGADALLTIDDINQDKIESAKILHFGSATALLENPFQETYLTLMKKANEDRIFTSFDPNYRSDLWKGRIDEFVDLAKAAISSSDFVKVSEEELHLITDTADDLEGIDFLHGLGAKIVSVTLGEKGTLLSNGKRAELVKSVPVVSVDSTGAGDAFVGATLYKLAGKENLEDIHMNFEQLYEIISFANKVGAHVCTKIGAIAALPSIEELHELSIS
ncbi:carbohydrate kinase family protein [Priestia endophytica]|jgi:fructokinase|uniref:carbohydrate kinase family protein n=1 Tax=Priestia endophytica TaxID=135735 RepID=UPI000F51FB4D|nr:carbohydrate kinase [Priestia endophytica]RPK03521.1 Fructokinase [Priestia endophytica]